MTEPFPSGPMPSLREQDLAGLWERGAVPPAALVTCAGDPIQIVYRGRPNNGAGPDFRDAIVALPDGRLLRGDIELHLRASDFRRHGHHLDRAYDRVILHLVYRADAGATTMLRNGHSVAIVALEPWLLTRSAELRAMLEQPALWREPCQDAIARLGRDEVGRTLYRLGERRLRIKAAAARTLPAASALYAGLLRTLGQGAQRPAWVELGRRAPATLIDQVARAEPGRAARAIEALLLGAARLLPESDGNNSAYLVESLQHWRRVGAPGARPISAAGAHRPANHPARRIAGLARLLAHGPDDLLARVHIAVFGDRPAGADLVGLFVVPADGAWSDHRLPWEAPEAGRMPALIGRGKAVELVVNAALPVILAEAELHHDTAMVEAALGAFHALPAPAVYGRTRHLARALQDGTSTLLARADAGQAALHLHAFYCTRGGCGRCPLS